LKHTAFPTPKTLIVVWLALMIATIGTMIAGKVTQVSSIGPTWILVLMGVTLLKASLILNYFLDLRSASKGWNKGFVGLVAVIVSGVVALYLTGL
jgi:hypothetical protein